MTNKNGFWVVICNEGGENMLCYDVDEFNYQDRAQFDSEEAAQAFVDRMRVDANVFYPNAQYYWKYIPWGAFS